MFLNLGGRVGGKWWLGGAPRPSSGALLRWQGMSEWFPPHLNQLNRRGQWKMIYWGGWGDKMMESKLESAATRRSLVIVMRAVSVLRRWQNPDRSCSYRLLPDTGEWRRQEAAIFWEFWRCSFKWCRNSSRGERRMKFGRDEGRQRRVGSFDQNCGEGVQLAGGWFGWDEIWQLGV